MNDSDYRQYCLDLLGQFSEQMARETKQASPDDPLRELAEQFAEIASGKDLYETGPAIVNRLFASCPQLAPSLPREILWFLGGDCLHFMPDEEIAQFQQLDEEREQAAAQGNVYDLAEARAKLLNLQ